jgi:hypothetical protein
MVQIYPVVGRIAKIASMLDVPKVMHVWVEGDWEPHRRSWPYPPTRLERLAQQAGVDDEALRAWLYEEVARRRRQAARRDHRDTSPSTPGSVSRSLLLSSYQA